MEPIGDKLFIIAAYIFGSAFVVGWLVLIIVMILEWIFPKSEWRLENFLQKISFPIEILQKYSLIALLVLLFIRWISGILGWTEPL